MSHTELRVTPITNIASLVYATQARQLIQQHFTYNLVIICPIVKSVSPYPKFHFGHPPSPTQTKHLSSNFPKQRATLVNSAVIYLCWIYIHLLKSYVFFIAYICIIINRPCIHSAKAKRMNVKHNLAPSEHNPYDIPTVRVPFHAANFRKDATGLVSKSLSSKTLCQSTPVYQPLHRHDQFNCSRYCIIYQFLWTTSTVAHTSGKHYRLVILFWDAQNFAYRTTDVILNNNQCNATKLT